MWDSIVDGWRWLHQVPAPASLGVVGLLLGLSISYRLRAVDSKLSELQEQIRTLTKSK